MRVNKSSYNEFGDILLPEVFVQEYMPLLSCEALKCYLFLLDFVQHGCAELELTDIAARLLLTRDKTERALQELSNAGLVDHLSEETLSLKDLKQNYLQKNYTKNDQSEAANLLISDAEKQSREKMTKDINIQFFQSMMSPGWYRFIDQLYTDYKFEPKVVFALMQELKSRQKMHLNYAKQVAADWYQEGIVTYEQLEQKEQNFQQRMYLVDHVGKAMRRHMTQPDVNIVQKWIKEYNYDLDIIDLALQKLTSSSRPSLKYVDAILQSWHEKHYQSREEIMRAESQEAADKKRNGDGRRQAAVSNVRTGKVSANFQVSNDAINATLEADRKIAEKLSLPRVKTEGNQG